MRRSATFTPHSTRARAAIRGAANPASFLGTFILAVILTIAPAILGADRLWIELPLLCGLGLLLLIQGVRLATPASAGSRVIDAIDLAAIVFVLYVIVRWLTSPVEFFSRLEAMNAVGYVVIFFFCRHGLASRAYAMVLLILIVVLGVSETAFGYLLSHHSAVHDPMSLWSPFGPREQLQLYFAPRWLGSFGNPNCFANFLVMTAGVALALGAFSKYPWPMRIVFFYLAALITIGILYSASRGSWLALLASVGALTIFGLRYGTLRWWIPVTGGLLIIASFGVVFALSPLVQDRVAEVTNDIRTGTLDKYSRVELSHDALRIAKDHLLFGTGPATFSFVHLRYQSPTLGVRAVYAHDDYLNTLDDYGILGFAIAMFFIMLVTLTLFHRVRADFRWQDRVIVAAGVTAWFAMLVHSFFDFNLHIPANAMIFFALVGMGLRRVSGEGIPRHWASFSLAPLGRGLGAVLFVFGLVYLFEAGRTALSDIVYEQTYVQAETEPTLTSIAGVKQALFYDSGNVEALDLLGDLYRIRASRGQNMDERVEDGQQALDAYQKALKANPLDDTIQAQLGLTYDILGRFPEAFFCYKAAVTQQPHNGQFWNALGNHFWKRYLLLQAEEAYLVAAACPHGGEGDAEGARQVQLILDRQGIPPPPPGADPLAPLPEPPEPLTTP